MSNKVQKIQSPLKYFVPPPGFVNADVTKVIKIREVPIYSYINLRGSPKDEKFVRAVEDTLNIKLPLNPNTTASNEQLLIYWLGPDEWLVFIEHNSLELTINTLTIALKDTICSITDVSGGYVAIEISGEKSREVLAKGCTLDLHPSQFGLNQCAQTLIGKTSVILGYVDGVPTFNILVRRSFTEYLMLWLHDSSLEYNLSLSLKS